jgi:protein-L-isoaspartate(D-aspartate) O-methyltransferase
MAYRTFASSQAGLVDSLVEYGVVQSPEVEQVLRQVDRGLFAESPEFAYLDAPHGIGYAATISAPHMHAYALELLLPQLRPGGKVLDVGSGTGYLTACFAKLVTRDGAHGKAVGIEHISELTSKARRNLGRDPALAQLVTDGALELVVGDGRLGWAAEAPYDAIHVGAAAPRLPQDLVAQLAPGGRLVVPIGPEGGMQVLSVVDKRPDGTVHRRDAMNVMYVPLCARDYQLASASPSSSE